MHSVPAVRARLQLRQRRGGRSAWSTRLQCPHRFWSRHHHAGQPVRILRQLRGSLPGGGSMPKMSIGKGRPWQVKKVKTVCSYCGVGCQLDSGSKRQPDHQGQLRLGRPGQSRLDLRERAASATITCNHPDRLTKPKVRQVPAGWMTPAEGRDGGTGSKSIGRPRWRLPRGNCARRAIPTGRQHWRPDLGQVHQRRKLPDEQTGAAGDRDEQHRPLRPSLTLQHRGRSGHFLWFWCNVELDG